MEIRDRIIELRRIRASQLRPHPRHWRTHPSAQQEAICGMLAELGFANALLARRLPEGEWELIDGHLRAEMAGEAEVPVLLLDLTEEETLKLLALHDPLGAMAEANAECLAALLADVEIENENLQTMLDSMLKKDDPFLDERNTPDPPDIPLPELFQVIVECRDEAEQKSVYERLSGEGMKCRLINL